MEKEYRTKSKKALLIYEKKAQKVPLGNKMTAF